MRHVANLVAAGGLLLTAFFVWSTLRFENEHILLPATEPYSQSARFGQGSQVAGASIVEEWSSSTVTYRSSSQTLVSGPAQSSEPSSSTSSPYAYVFYATTDDYACSVLVNIYRLRHVVHSRYPIHVLASSNVSRSLISAMEEVDALVHIERPPALASTSGAYYQDCLLKLLAFKLHCLSPGLERVLAFDSDQLIMQNLDDLFAGLPRVDLAAPRAYWLAKDVLASTFMMIQLSDRLWSSVRSAFKAAGDQKFDMDIVNDLLGDEVMMLSGECVALNSHWEDWNLPKWHHPNHVLNMTTINRLNALAQQARFGGYTKRQAVLPSGNSSFRNASTHAALPPHAASSPAASFASPSTIEPTVVPAKPRFPDGHPLSKELFQLGTTAAVIHFSALGKPWAVTEQLVRMQRPDAHPLLGEQFRIWRETAAMVCPGRY